MSETRIDTADAVYHIPTGEEWLVAYADYDTGKMSWCGWPDGEAEIADCELRHKATVGAKLKLLAQLAGSQSVRRAAYAKRQLAKVDAPADQAHNAGEPLTRE